MHEAILEGSMLRTRSILITGFTAIFGLLPAALSTRVGAQAQRPLAIVVIGGMLMALFLLRYLTPVLWRPSGQRFEYTLCINHPCQGMASDALFYPKHEYGCPNVGHCSHLGGAALGSLVL